MRQELTAAVDFILRLLRLKPWTPDQLRALRQKLLQCLCERYRGHWYPDQPYRGQAYRCIRINASQPPDQSLLAACVHCGIDYTKLGLPEELTLWIDPYEVYVRFGENSPCLPLAVFPKEILRQKAHSISTTSDYSSGSTSPETVSETSSEDELIVKDHKSEMEQPSCNKTPTPVLPGEAEKDFVDFFCQTCFDSSDTNDALEGSRLMTIWKNVQAPTATMGDDSALV